MLLDRFFIIFHLIISLIVFLGSKKCLLTSNIALFVLFPVAGGSNKAVYQFSRNNLLGSPVLPLDKIRNCKLFIH